MGQVLEERRSFLAWVINGLGAIFAAILGFPIVCYLIDPRNRKAPPSNFKLADGARLGELTTTLPVVQGVIRDVRRDAWTLHPNDVLGRVWVVLQPNKQIPTSAEDRKKLKSTDASPPIKVFTTVCPHLNCSVNLSPDGASFACPCHAATFDRKGDRLQPEHNPALRGLDELEWEADPADPDGQRLLVKYRAFKAAQAAKEEVGAG